MFDGSYAYSVTERGCAMVFPINHQQAHPHQVSRHEGEGEQEGKTNDDDVDIEAQLRPFEIDLNEDR